MIPQSVRAKFLLVTLVSIGMVFYLALSNYLVLGQMIVEIEHSQASTGLLRRHMHGDMMHDAIRADVLMAALGLQTKDAGMIAEAKTSLAEHSDAFLTDLRENLEAEVSREIRASLQKAEPALRAYSDDARRFVEAATTDMKTGAATSAALMPNFEDSFEALAEAQEATTVLIEKSLEDLRDSQTEQASSANFNIIIISVLTMGAVLLLPVVSQALLFKPLALLIATMNKLAAGERRVSVPYVGRTDEIGEMSASLLVFQENAEQKIRLEVEQAALKEKTDTERRKAMLDLANGFEARVGELVRTVASAATELQATSASMSRTSQAAVEQAGSVSAASEQSAQNASAVASATEELSASFGEINQRMASSTEYIQGAVSQTKDTAMHVKRLDEAARKIGEVVKLISDIAEQTNLLALNATIEAARAGDAGKGFAVVASEVKMLANQTAKATEEVGSQIRQIQAAVQESSKAMTAVASSIDGVRDISAAIARAIEDQNAATQNIAGNIAETSRASNDIRANIGGVVQAAEETVGAAGEVLSAAGELSRSGEMLSEQVEQFLAEVRNSK